MNRKILLIFFGILYSSYCLASYCPEPLELQKHIKAMQTQTFWIDKYGRKWDMNRADIIASEIDYNPYLRFIAAFTENFPYQKEGTFIICHYFYSKQYKSGVSITSRSFKLAKMPEGRAWDDKGACEVDPFNENNPNGTGNILDCPFDISPETVSDND